MKTFEQFSQVNEKLGGSISEREIISNITEMRNITSDIISTYKKVVKILDKYDINYEIGRETNFVLRVDHTNKIEKNYNLELRVTTPHYEDEGYNWYEDIKPALLKAGVVEITSARQIWIKG